MKLRKFRLFVEGVEIPFLSANISSAYGEMPQATIEVPPHTSLSSLGRNYHPKVHIFFLDPLSKSREDSDYKQLFSGIITGVQESKYVSTDGGQRTMTLTAVHHLSLLKQILIRFGAQTLLAPVETQIAVSQSHDATHEAAIHQSLRSVVDSRSDANGRHTDSSDQFLRLQGSPGVMKVYWERLLSRISTADLPQSVTSYLGESAVSVKTQIKGDTDALALMYKDLVTEGLGFWDKLTGHPLVEGDVDEDRVAYNKASKSGGDGSPFDIILPMKFKTFIGNQAEVALAVRILKTGLQAVNPEVSSFYDYFMEYLALIDYSMTTLNSPSSTGIEYIVKPTLPTYYAPICNVVMPQMVSNVSVSSNFGEMPSRVMNVAYPVPGGPQSGAPGAAQSQTYVAPASVRNARSDGDLQDTLRPQINAVGKHEWGSGISPRLVAVPEIYNIMGHSLQKKDVEEQGSAYLGNVAKKKEEAKEFWKNMYGPDDSKNPFSDSSGLSSWSRMMILWVDQQYSVEAYRSRTAQAMGDFNPYAVVGYPMDIVDPSPFGESYHGFCVNISHMITAEGSSQTTYGLASVCTISELMMFKPPAVAPALAVNLGFTKDQTIYGNAEAYEKACHFYGDVLGVGAAEPALLQDDKGMMREFTRDGGVWSTDGNFTGDDQKLLIARNILSMEDFDFIKMEDWMDSGLSAEAVDNYGRNSVIPNEASPYLDYED